MRRGPSSFIGGTVSQSFQTGTRTPCSGDTGQSRRDKSKRRLYLPMDDGCRPNAHSSGRLIAAAESQVERIDFSVASIIRQFKPFVVTHSGNSALSSRPMSTYGLFTLPRA